MINAVVKTPVVEEEVGCLDLWSASRASLVKSASH